MSSRGPRVARRGSPGDPRSPSTAPRATGLQSCPAMIPVEEALEIVLREARALPHRGGGARRRALPRAGRGRRLRSRPAARSTARRWTATRCGRPTWPGAPAALDVVGEVRAGQWPDLTVGPGQAVRIMTGAPVPPGADSVQQVEKTQPLDEFRVTILSPVAEGANVAPRGSEVRAGDVVLARGRVIDPAAIAVLASAGKARVRVARRPVVALLVTGDEIVEVSATPAPGQIRNSNGPAVAAQARLAGADGAPPRRRPRPAGRDRGGPRRRARAPTCSSSPAASRPATTTSSSPRSWSWGRRSSSRRWRSSPGRRSSSGGAAGRSSSACPATPSRRR